jgi:acetyltransferase-like isoleucine patch superfamily enzyme
MIEILKTFYWSIKVKWGRLQIKMLLLRNIPGEYGILIRSRMLRKYFAAAGDGLRVMEGFKFRNIHKIKVGNNVSIGVDNFIQAGGGVEIGDHTLMGPGVKIWTQNHIFDDPYKPILEQGAEYRGVSIGRNCWIGANTFIMPGADIGDGVIISAGAVVGAKPVKSYSILAGNPARVIGTRLKEPNKNEDSENPDSKSVNDK